MPAVNIAGSKDRIAYFFGGHLNQLIEASTEQCGNAAYKPFPELEKLCLAASAQSGRSPFSPAIRLRIIGATELKLRSAQTCRSTIAFFNSAISFAGLRPFGQAFEQFMMVWQR